jgi:hypothetical protein
VAEINLARLLTVALCLLDLSLGLRCLKTTTENKALPSTIGSDVEAEQDTKHAEHLPVRRMISLVPTPSALNSTKLARHACAGCCGPVPAPSDGGGRQA